MRKTIIIEIEDVVSQRQTKMLVILMFYLPSITGFRSTFSWSKTSEIYCGIYL